MTKATTGPNSRRRPSSPRNESRRSASTRSGAQSSSPHRRKRMPPGRLHRGLPHLRRMERAAGAITEAVAEVGVAGEDEAVSATTTIGMRTSQTAWRAAKGATTRTARARIESFSTRLLARDPDLVYGSSAGAETHPHPFEVYNPPFELLGDQTTAVVSSSPLVAPRRVEIVSALCRLRELFTSRLQSSRPAGRPSVCRRCPCQYH